MGKCYTFNEGDGGKIQNIPGSGHGLKMVLNVQQSSYTEEPFVGFDEAGLRLQVSGKVTVKSQVQCHGYVS